MKCLHCGKEFEPTLGSVKQIYCSRDCREAAQKKRNCLPSAEKFCIVCETKLKGRQRLYCSNKCRKKLERKAEKEQIDAESKLIHSKKRTIDAKNKKSTLTYAQIEALARACGMTYGQYVAVKGL